MMRRKMRKRKKSMLGGPSTTEEMPSLNVDVIVVCMRNMVGDHVILNLEVS